MTKTLLIDGNNLFKIGFYGVKDLFSDGDHIGGVYHFINIIRKFLEEHNHDKVIVFWDSETNSTIRKNLYPKYKENRSGSIDKFKVESFDSQMVRVKQYLEEVFVRQAEVPNNEADDLIAYYCRIAKDEQIMIFSSDKDLTQLISEKVSVYSPATKKYYKNGDSVTINKVEIPHKNVLTCKVFVGDKSDNIEGVESLGEKTLVKFFPDIQNRSCTIEEIIEHAKEIVETSEKNKIPKALSNILTGKTKNGIIGEELYRLNKKIVDLSNPLITEDGIEIVEQIYRDSLDPENRGHKNLIRMMMKDGLFNYLPKNDEAWVDFMRPFMKLIRKEKNINLN
jgi:DNA polymerase-1